MKEEFAKYLYKSDNLKRLEDLFLDEKKTDGRLNLTSKNIRSPFGRDIDIDFSQSNRNVGSQSINFIKKYNRVLDEFATKPNDGKKSVQVDLEEKLKLRFLQSQIEANKSTNKDSFTFDTEDIKNNFIIGSPARYMTRSTFADSSLRQSPRRSSAIRKSPALDFDFSNNNFNKLRALSPKQYHNDNNFSSQIEMYGLKRQDNYLSTKKNHNKLEILSYLTSKDKDLEKKSYFAEKISSLQANNKFSSMEHDLKKKIILSGKTFLLR